MDMNLAAFFDAVGTGHIPAVAIAGGAGMLVPVTRPMAEDPALTMRLRDWRAAALHAFSSQMHPTAEGTGNWLRGITGPGASRALFLVCDAERHPHGHLGVCRAPWADDALAVENVLRGDAGGPRMADAMLALAVLVRSHLPVGDLTLEVFSDLEPALRLYRRLGFVEMSQRQVVCDPAPDQGAATLPVQGRNQRTLIRFRLDLDRIDH